MDGLRTVQGGADRDGVHDGLLFFLVGIVIHVAETATVRAVHYLGLAVVEQRRRCPRLRWAEPWCPLRRPIVAQHAFYFYY